MAEIPESERKQYEREKLFFALRVAADMRPIMLMSKREGDDPEFNDQQQIKRFLNLASSIHRWLNDDGRAES